MTIFRSFKNQSHRPIFRNFINQGVTNHCKIKTLRCFGLRTTALQSKTQHIKKKKWINEERRIKIATKILDEVKDQFLESKEFIDERLKQEFSKKENISVEEVILFTCLEAKS